MKAITLESGFGIDHLRLVDLPEPVPGPRQALVRLRAASLNYRDMMMVKGLYNPKLAQPFVPLSDGVGEVVATGEEVTRVRPGERVAGAFFQAWFDGELTESAARSALGGGGPGMLAEYVALGEGGLVHVPDHLTDEEAATLPCAGVTAWNALAGEDPLLPGQTVLTLGTGGVSLFALQFARLQGARVLLTSGSDEKIARALELGAAHGINYRTTPDWDTAARDLAGAGGIDRVIELGGAGTLARSLRAVRTSGQIALIGVLAGGAGEVNLAPVLMKHVRIQGIFVGSRAAFEAMNRAIALHRLRPVVDRVFPFTEAVAALGHLESGVHFGKICLRF